MVDRYILYHSEARVTVARDFFDARYWGQQRGQPSCTRARAHRGSGFGASGPVLRGHPRRSVVGHARRVSVGTAETRRDEGGRRRERAGVQAELCGRLLY